MAGIPSESEKKLYGYMHGWRLGAKGSCLIPGLSANPDVLKGYNDGRLAYSKVYREACKTYDAELTTLR